MKYTFPLFFLFILLFQSCKEDTSNSDTIQLLHEIIHEDWEFRLKENPLNASNSGDTRYNDRLPEVSLEAENRRLAFYESTLEKLDTLEGSSLERQDAINLAMLKFILEDDIAQIKQEAYLQPLNAEGGFMTTLLQMPDQMPFETLEDYQNYIKRLKAIPAFLEGQVAMLKLGMEKGKTFPQILMAEYEIKLPGKERVAGEKSPFMRPFEKMPERLNEEQRDELKNEVLTLLEDETGPAFDQARAFFLETYIPGARESLGVSELPEGKAYYEQRVRFFTTLDLSPDDVFEKGMEEVSRIKAEMEEIIEALEFEGSFADFLHFLRTDPQFYAEDERSLIEYASYVSKNIDGKLPQFFGKLPRLPYGVEKVPDEIAPFYTTGRYVSGSRENHKSGTYWVNTYNLEQRPLYNIPALSLHEAVPGHHLQIALSQEMEGLPPFRKFTYLSAFGEGWALYTEKLGVEMGIYETPYEHFGRLTYEMWRACRLVVDVGMHSKGWTRDEAMDFMASNTALSLHNVKTEIDRYIGWPAQALSYKIGELKIVELREKAEAELGEAFNIREFHDKILENGSVPLFILEEQIDTYLADKKSGN